MFVEIGKSVTEFIDSLDATTTGIKYVQDLLVVLEVGLLISILWQGYQILFGKSQSPLNEALWQIFRKGIIISVIMAMPSYINEIKDAADGIFEWFGGGNEGLYSKLDVIYGKGLQFKDNCIHFWTEEDSFFGDLIAYVMYTPVLIAIIFALIPGFMTIFIAQITNTVLIMTFPIAFCGLLFQPTRQIFVQWLNLIISNLLLIFIVMLMLNIIQKLVFGEINHAVINHEFYAFSAIPIFLIAFIGFALLKLAKAVAQGLAQVSIDGATSAAFASSAGALGLGVGLSAKGMATGSQGMATAGMGAAKFGLGTIRGFAGKALPLKASTAQKIGSVAGSAIKVGGSNLASRVKSMATRFRGTK